MDTQRLYLKVYEQCGCQFESHFAATRYCSPRCANLSKKHKLRDERLQNLGDDVRERERLALLDKNVLTIADAARLIQLEAQSVHLRALQAWRSLDRLVQEQWNMLALTVYSHRPPFNKDHHICGYNLFVSAYDGFAKLGNEHVPFP